MWLAIETALHACSAALIEGDRLVAARHEVIARGHAERLIPLVAELMDDAGVQRADGVLVDVGPGSFTGIRVGIAAAKAFALAWNAPVHGCTSTSLVAAGVFAAHPELDRLHVAFDASRGEVYLQSFRREELAPENNPIAIAPDAAAQMVQGGTVAGSGAALLQATDPSVSLIEHLWPVAADARYLPQHARMLAPRPLYIRAPDAKVPT